MLQAMADSSRERQLCKRTNPPQEIWLVLGPSNLRDFEHSVMGLSASWTGRITLLRRLEVPWCVRGSALPS